MDTTTVPITLKRRRMGPGTSDGDGEPKRTRRLRQLSHDEYTVAWVCALHIERAAAEAMLDETHTTLPGGPNDSNTYTMGNIGPHNIVITSLPTGHYGTNNAAVAANDISRSFPSIETRFMIGIGGGVPNNADIRLGDVVVSTEVFQYDYGKTMESGVFQITSHRVKPPHKLMKALSKLRAQHEKQKSTIPQTVARMIERYPRMQSSYAFQSSLADRLFDSAYEHDPTVSRCEECDPSRLVKRRPRSDTDPKIHYGLIASGNQVMKASATRDSLASREDVKCFEMEAAGLVDHFPCLIIRGICDYSDSHKSKEWQGYASATAAAYAKEVLSLITPKEIQSSGPQDQKSSQLTQEQRKTLLDSLMFEQIDTRRLNIKKAYDQTCKWILRQNEYLDWQDYNKIKDHRGFLWIKGKPGAGKSTLMKFVFLNAQKTMKKTTVIGFFFHARGSALEKSTTGMYRSLLVQLFGHLPVSQSALDNLGLTNWSAGRVPEWNIELLTDLFEQAILTLRDYSVACFIDALDECDQQEIRDMLEFFEHVCEVAIMVGLKLHICLSSRHYPHISIDFGLSLTLEGQEGHNEDLCNYIRKKLKVDGGERAKKIQMALQDKAKGVFMWVVLVVDILNQEHVDGRTHNLLRRLDKFPESLHDLFRNIIARHSSNRAELVLCLQWVLFAKEPLTPAELYFAIRTGIDDEAIEPWDREETTTQDMKRFILSSSKGLAEVTISSLPTVQLIHESVRDFLLKDGGLQSIWPQTDNLQGHSHTRLKECCIKYTNASVTCWRPNTRYSRPGLYRLQTFAVQKFPFLKYAINNVFFHAETACAGGISQHGFLENEPQLKRWIILHNTLEIRAARQYSLDARLLYILAEANTPKLIRECSPGHKCLEEKKERFGSPILAAIVAGNSEVVLEFRAALMANLEPSSPVHTLLEKDRQDGCKRSKISYEKASDYKSSNLLCLLAEYGDPVLISLLLDAGYDWAVEATDSHGLTPLLCAAAYGHPRTTRTLLKGIKRSPYLPGLYLATQLLVAIKKGLWEAVHILVQFREINPYLVRPLFRPPLSTVLKHGMRRGLQSFLDTRILREVWNSKKLLHIATKTGDSEGVRILLASKKVDPNLLDADGSTPLRKAVSLGHHKVVRALLKSKRVDPNQGDRYGETPLSHAAKMGNVKMVRSFLKCDRVNISSRDNLGRTALYYAVVYSGNTKIVRLLLHTKCFDINSSDNSGRTVLSYAAQGRNKEIEALLVAQRFMRLFSS